LLATSSLKLAMNPIDYCFRIESGRDEDSERVVMARIALNTLVDPHAYPVDMSELACLSTEPNILTRSMLNYCVIHPEYFGSLAQERARYLAALVSRGPRKSDSTAVEGGTMNAAELYNHILEADRNQALMARILINAMGGSASYPVDVSELRNLSQKNRIAIDAFLCWRRWSHGAMIPIGENMIRLAAT
jgi:hypothetical protein